MYDRVYESHVFNNPKLPFIFQRMNSGMSTAVIANWHTNLEILFCLKGEGSVFYDSEYIPFAKGDLVVVNSEVLHRINADSHIEFYYIIIDDNFCSDNGFDVDKMHFASHIRDDKAKALFESLINSYTSSDELSIPKARLAVISLLTLLFEKYRSEGYIKPEQSSNIKRVRKAMMIMNEHYNEKITLEVLAEKLMINKYYLAHEFKHYTGQTVFEYLNLIRCNEVKRRIKRGDSIATAASECGFYNMSYFTRAYKKYMGVLPSEHKARK